MKNQTCCNNDCNQGRACPQRQSRAECHVACSAPAQKSYAFAPGVIQGSAEYGKPLWRVETLAFWLVVLASLGALVVLVGFAIGYFNLEGLLP
jgi:hypothetical protein